MKTIVKNKLRNYRWKYLLIALAIVLVVLLLEAFNVTHFFHHKTTLTPEQSRTPTTGGASVNNDKGEPSTSSSGDASQPGDQKSSSGSGDTNSVLSAPSGDFVSNHHPNLSGSPAPNILSSVCTTTPGASCVVSFTNGSTTKSLTAQVTDRGGSTYWNNWSLQDIGLSAGSWTVKATATLGNQSKSTTDSLTLVVSP